VCGIAGILRAGAADGRCVQRMTTLLRHRGPDDEGYVAVVAAGSAVALAGPETAPGCLPDETRRVPDDGFPEGADLVLGARRLAILDLSPSGHQPMGSAQGCWIVHNGEIYNYRELHEELAGLGHSFRGGSDTEVALAAYEEWGIRCFERFNGMWATAIWDQPRRTLVLSRDRFGVKPLYFASLGGGVVFASEIKALLAAGVPARARDYALQAFLDTGRIDITSAGTCFEGIEQVEPGTVVEWPLRGAPRTTRFYSLAARPPEDGDHASELIGLLDDAVGLRLRSDVPVGSCLSGGLDSSAVVSLAQARLDTVGERMRTFTFSAATEPLDETRFASSVAERAGVDPSFATAPSDLADQLEAAAWDQDEPVGSGSVVAQRLVMALANAHGAKVLLDGQGGDEVLAGYSYYRPARLADLAASLRLGAWLGELRAAVGSDGLTARWLARATLGELRRRRPGLGRLAARQFEDVRLHLPALLHYEDRNSMAFSIEARLPFLDYRLVEFGLGLPGASKIQGGWTKAVLRRALDDRLPPAVVWRRDKVQFSVPQAQWLRGPLRELAFDLLLGPSFAARPVGDAPAARALLAQIDVLDGDGADRLWRLLAVELWYRTFLDAPVRRPSERLAPAS
jgi:asparagine synthase (glutamine-hydrolysing)